MKNKRLNRVLSMGMACVMVLSLVSGPLEVHAAEIDWTPPVEVTVPIQAPVPETTTPAPTEEPSPAPSPEAPAVPTEEPEPTETPEATATPIPSPTATPDVPVETPIPTESPAIPTPTPEAPEETPAPDGEELPEFDEAMFMALMASGAYNINSGNVRLTSPGDYTITGDGNKTTNTISVTAAGTYNITINNVNIDCSATAGACAFQLTNGATVNLTLVNASTLTSGSPRAGIEVPEGCTLYINGSGSVTATGGTEQNFSGAGIGGSKDMINGPITINSGTVTANGGSNAYYGAAGIGGGCKAAGQNITINGGFVTANGSSDSYYGAAGIGGGAMGAATNITIAGATSGTWIKAAGSSSSLAGGAGIGGGCFGNASDFIISGNQTTATPSSNTASNGAGIGGGYGGTFERITISGGIVTVNRDSQADGSNGAGIGGGGRSAETVDKNTGVTIPAAGGDARDITITGGTLNVNGCSRGAGIGGGAGGNAVNIQILGGNITARGGSSMLSGTSMGGVGIGGGGNGVGKDILIKNKDARVNAFGGTDAAGIGGGSGKSGINITIESYPGENKTSVYANSSNYGAGIGGGGGGAGVNILIKNSIVEASGSSYGSGIGSGGNCFGLTDNSIVIDVNVPGGNLLLTNVLITGSIITASGNYGAGIGTGQYNGWNGSSADKNNTYAVVNIQDSTINANSGSYGAGIGLGYQNRGAGANNVPDCTMSVDIIINGCTITRASASSYGAGIGVGYSSNYFDVRLDIRDCPSITANGSSYGAGIGTGQSCSYYKFAATIENCPEIIATATWSAALGVGSSNSYYDFAMIIDDCAEISAIANGTGIGTGDSSSYGTAQFDISNCKKITAKNTSSNSNNGGPGIGWGNYNSRSKGFINISNCETLDTGAIAPQAAIGTGYNCNNSMEGDLGFTINLTDCAVISATGGQVGIGAGQSTNNTKLTCNIIGINTRPTITATGGEGSAIGYGESCSGGTYQFTARHCGDIRATSGYASGIGLAPNNNNMTMTAVLEDCGDITATSGSGSNTDCGSGIGGANGNGATFNASIKNCGNITATTGSYGAGIGAGQQMNSSNTMIELENCKSITASSRYGAAIGTGYYCDNATADISLKNCGAIKTTNISGTSGESNNGACIGTGSQNRVCTVAIEIVDCDEISAMGGTYYTTGIGTGQTNRNVKLDISIVRPVGSERKNITADAGQLSAVIGTGYNNYLENNSATPEPTVRILIQNYGDILMQAKGNNVTGIGTGQNNYSNYSTPIKAEITIENCGDISLDGQNYEYITGIGTGYSAFGNTNGEIAIRNCGDISLTGGRFSMGIGANRSYENNGFKPQLGITVSDCGDITATVRNDGTAIGVGQDSKNCIADITILRCGNILADGAAEKNYGNRYGVGIGVGTNFTNNMSGDPLPHANITLRDCASVIARGGSYGGAGVGTGYNCSGKLGLAITVDNCGTLTASSGDPTATGKANGAELQQGAAIGTGAGNTGNGSKGNIIIKGTTVVATAERSAGIGFGNGSGNGTLTVELTDCDISASGKFGAAIGTGRNTNLVTANITLTNCTTRAYSAGYSAGVGNGCGNTASSVAVKVIGDSLDAKGKDGGAGIGCGPMGTSCVNQVYIEGDPIVTALGSASSDSRFDVNGSAGNELIDADAKKDLLGAGAGIGGAKKQDGGSIYILGGTVTATGSASGEYACAGIGGGVEGGNITISGGTVVATAGKSAESGAAGIGGGSGSGGSITISGGTVTAIGSNGEKIGGAGIGGGARGDAGTITITDGTIIAVGSERGAGIGGGFGGNGGAVKIAGGDVTATGGLYDSAGIGGGANGTGGTLLIEGTPILKAYGKSANPAISSTITTTVPVFQGSLAEVRDSVSELYLKNLANENDMVKASLPANYDAFSIVVPNPGVYSTYLELEKDYLLATMADGVEQFALESGAAVEARQLGVVRFYDVAFSTDGGSEVSTQSVRVNNRVTIPEEPTRGDDIFAGWFTDAALTTPYDFSLPVTANLTLYAKWIEIEGRPYMVYHYKENLEGGWDIGSIEYGGSKPTDLVTATPISYTGFVEDKRNPNRVPSGYTVEGSTLELKLYYKRQTITVDIENAGADYTKITAPYGTLIVLQKPTKEGYDFDKWTKADGSVIEAGMPVSIQSMGSVIYANWVLQEGRAAYQVKHYLRSLEGAYVLRVAEDLSGTVGDSVTLTPNDYTGFHVNHSISDETATGIIQADNSLALRVYYDRDIITVKLLDTHNTAASVSVEYGAAANLPTPSWPGYTFNGWKRADGTIYKDGDTIETLGEAVTAQWSAGATTLYTVRYYKQDTKGETMEIVSLEDLQGAAGSTVNAAIRTYPGFTYDSALSNASGVVDAETPLILNIYYTRNTYTMTYRSNGGSAVAAQSGVYYQTLADTPEPPTKTGYDFAGWHTDTALMDKHSFAIPVTQDLTLYAKWTSRDDTAYTVLHFQQDVSGSGYTLSDTDELAGITDATVTAAPKDYDGFYEHTEHTDRVSSAAVKPDGSTVLKVYYLRNLHKVTFDSNSGSAVKPVTGIRYEAAIAAPIAPTRTGYTFQHWCADEELKNEYDFETPITADMTLYALWLANTYVVTLNYQGATGGNSTASMGVTYDATYGTLPTPTRDGYAFDGWFTAKQGGTEITAETTVKITANQILYARWTANTDTPYKVEYWRQNVDGKGYTKHETENLTATTDTTVTAEVKEYEGFSEDSANTGRVPSGQVAGNGSTVLKLYYTRHTHTLTVDRANGTAVETETVYYGANRVLPADPARKGYTFEGWNVEGVEMEGKKYAMPDNNVIITAIWQAIDYSVTYKYTGTVPQGAPALPDGGKNHNIGDVLEVAPAPTLDGYVLYGWLTKDVSIKDGKFTMPDGNVTFTGEWRTANYNVVYVYQGNVPDKAPKPPVDGAVHQVGDTVSMLSAPEFPGYEFSGWTASVQVNDDGEFTMPVGNVIFRGSWSPLTYSADFTYSGEAPDNAPQFPDLSGYKVGDMVAVPSVDPIEGYTFGGWQLNGEPIVGGAFPMPVGGATVVGVWVRNTYAVTYAYTGYVPKDVPNAPIMSKRYHMGDSVTVAAVPAAKGYTCSTWTTAEAAVANGSFTMPGHDVGFTASWTVNSYSIKYEFNGGTAGGTDKSAYTVETPSFTFSTPTRDGFTFGGWYADAGFTTSITGVTLGSTGDLTVYAKWTEKQKPVPPSGGGGGGGGGGGPVIPPTPEQPLNKTDHIAYIKGFGDGTVRPMAQITRAEVAQIFYRLLTDDARKKYGTTSNSFTDSNVGDWYNEAVSTLAAMGIVSGKGEGLFAPMDNITRAEFAAIAARFDSDSYTGPDKFSDIATSWAREEINRAAHKGWVSGDGAGAFRPNDLMTRAEAVVLINNLLERHINADGLLPGMLTFSDNKDKAAWYYYPIQEATNRHIYTRTSGTEKWTSLVK